VAALHAVERGDLARLEDTLDVAGGERQLQGVGVPPHHLVHDVDLLEGCAHGGLAGEGSRHVDGPELPADAAGAQPREVGVQRRLRLPHVELREIPPALLAHRPGIVVVPVDERRLPVNGAGALEWSGLRADAGRQVTDRRQESGGERGHQDESIDAHEGPRFADE
jgi:hypothetical protein